MSILDRFRASAEKAAPDPDKPDPPNPKSRGDSGRAHTSGFLQLEEFNTDLQHPHGHDVFDKMYRTDADVKQVVALTTNPISGGTWGVTPGGGADATDLDKKCAAALEEAIFTKMEPALPEHLQEFMPILFRSGFSPGEIVWAAAEFEATSSKLLYPETIQVRLPRTIHRFYQERGRLTGIQQQLAGWKVDSAPTPTPMAGYRGSNASPAYDAGPTVNLGLVDIMRKDLIYYRMGAEGDNWEGVSLLRPAYKHWLIKDGVEKMEAVAQEREALGIPIIYAPPGASDKQLDDLEQAVADMRTGDVSYIFMPGLKAGAGAPEGTGWLIELLGFDRAGSGRDPHPLLQYHTLKIAAAFIADFMKLGHGSSGSRATAQVQADPFLASVEAIVGGIERELQRQIAIPFTAYNFKGAKVPKISMSLVDQTSLSALADFVLKLSQVGALMPDQQLENFLRKRADLPDAEAVAIDDRGKDDGDMRRAVVGASEDPMAGVDPFGANAPAGAHKGGKPAGSPLQRGASKAPGQVKRGTTQGRGGAGSGAPRGAATLDEDSEYVTLAWAGYTPTRHEETVDLEALDGDMTDSGDMMLDALQSHVLAIAKGAKPDHEAMAKAAHGVLHDRYHTGRAHVRRETGRGPEVSMPQPEYVGTAGDGVLSASMDDKAALVKRAKLVARRTVDATETARDNAHLEHGAGAHAQAAGEKAGSRVAKRQGLVHGVAAVQHGRHDEILDSGSIGVVYSAVLDRGTCGHCADADDGVVRTLDDPVRLEHRPPNRQCDSRASGENLCRCIEIPAPLP